MATEGDAREAGASGTFGSSGAGMNGGMNGESSEPTGTSGGVGQRVGDAAAAFRGAAGQATQVAGEVAGEVANRLPAAAATTAATTRDVMNVAQRQMASSSNEMLTAGTMLSLGVALGLLLAGSSRLLVAIAVIPAAAMGATLIDRRNAPRI